MRRGVDGSGPLGLTDQVERGASWPPPRKYLRYTIFVLSAVLALDTADRATVSVAAPVLKKVFHITNGDIGLLASAFIVVGTLATVPVGVLADRVSRVRVLAVSIALWGATAGMAGAAASYVMLFVSRMFLGIAAATNGPTITSLTGDMYPADERGKVLGIISTGTLIGTLIGFVLIGVVVDAFSWRWGFWIFMAPAAALTMVVWRLREPPRGEHERRAARTLLANQGAATGTDVGTDPLADLGAEFAGSGLASPGGPFGDIVDHPGPTTGHVGNDMVRALRDRGVEPDERLVLRGNQSELPMREVVRYLLRIRSNTVILIANSVGNFFLSGITIFAVTFFHDQYHMSVAAAGATSSTLAIGAVGGFLFGGFVGDRLVRRGLVTARLQISIWSQVIAAVALFLAFTRTTLGPAVPLFLIGGAALVVHFPALDAVRLEIVHPQLWGRAESVRTVMRVGAEAAAPALFGFLADNLHGGGTAGLKFTIVISLPVLFVNGFLLLWCLPTYPREVASMLASSATMDDLPPPGAEGA